MRVGILWQSKNRGFYSDSTFETLYKQIGHNSGNLVFVYAIENQVDSELSYWPWHANPSELNANCDLIIVPSANQLGKHTDLGGLAKNFAKVDIPIISIGLGAQAENFDADVELSEGTRAWLDVLLDNGRKHGISNIYTRGPYTTEQIKKITGEDVVTGGCPSHFISHKPNLGRELQARWENHPYPRSIAVAGGHQAWAKVMNIEHQLISMMMDPLFPGIYMPQSMGDMLMISRGLFDQIDPKVLSKINRHTVPHYSLEEFKAWANRYARSYYEVPAWADDLKRHDLVIGARYHGCALAVQAGVMACTVTIDSRTEEMCRQTGVPFVSSEELTGPITRARLRNEIIKFDGAAYDSFRAEKCRGYLNFLDNAGVPPKSFLRDIASSEV